MKINENVETILSHAVALDQSGGLRNTIYAIQEEIYILNYDHTVLLRFNISNNDTVFDPPISFKANDYDSDEFDLIEGKVVFTSNNDMYTRKKTCGTGEMPPDEVKQLYRSYLKQAKEDRQFITLSNKILEVLDGNLSHIEFSGEKGGSIKLLQRNIYSGGVIEVTDRDTEQEALLSTNELEEDFGPVAMKTNDFAALFTFNKELSLAFPTKGQEDFILVQGVQNKKMKGVAACCLYDEIIKIKEVKDGRQKPKVRRRK